MDIDIDVGARLRTIRQMHGLSQRELAKRSGVTNATISLIESNTTSPSVGNLKRVLDGVPMGLAEFFAFDLTNQERIFFPEGEMVEIGRGGISYKQVGNTTTGRKIQMLHEHYEPATDSGKVPIHHEGEECGIIIRGKLEVQVGDQRRTLGPGDAYYFDSKQPHRFRNVGDEICEVVTACTPPSF